MTLITCDIMALTKDFLRRFIEAEEIESRRSPHHEPHPSSVYRRRLGNVVVSAGT